MFEGQANDCLGIQYVIEWQLPVARSARTSRSHGLSSPGRISKPLAKVDPVAEQISTSNLAERRRTALELGYVGWLCFALGMILMFQSLLYILLYIPLFVAAFILSIPVMANGRIGSGAMLLVASLIGPPGLFVFKLWTAA